MVVFSCSSQFLCLLSLSIIHYDIAGGSRIVSEVDMRSGAISKLVGVSADLIKAYAYFENTHERSNKCEYFTEEQGKDWFLNDKFGLYSKYGLNIFASLSCEAESSLGNHLGFFFENLMCAHNSGLHFFSLQSAQSANRAALEATPFFQNLPAIMQHERPLERAAALSRMKQRCTCPTRTCWSYHGSNIYTDVDVIRPILWKCIEAQLNISSSSTDTAVADAKGQLRTTIVRVEDICTEPVGSVLPLVPEVAIHYRCSDNFVGKYGFLPFRAFSDSIREQLPWTSSTQQQQPQQQQPQQQQLRIYVLSESRSRHAHGEHSNAQMCDEVFQSLFDYLREHFPTATVLISRGGEVFVDFYRLASAPVTICSVSTFCMWPAMINKQHALFPASRIIANGQTHINAGFKWLEQPLTLPGAPFLHSNASVLLAKLLD